MADTAGAAITTFYCSLLRLAKSSHYLAAALSVLDLLASRLFVSVFGGAFRFRDYQGGHQ
ncbi:hypothetical protein BaRGS_00033291, partial [Batillaria attramentaria]